MIDGWYKTRGAHKLHYFMWRRSLCPGWMLGSFNVGPYPEPTPDTQQKYCVVCWRRLCNRRKPRKHPHPNQLKQISGMPGPLSTEVFSTEEWRRYWIGKHPQVKQTVEDYITRFRTPDQETHAAHCERHGIVEPVLRNHLRALEEAGLLREIPEEA